MAAPMHSAWIAHFPTTNRRFWSGDFELTFGGNTYEAASGIRLTDVTDQLGSPDRRVQAFFRVSDPALRAVFLQDIGPEPVTIEWIVSSDRGISWTRLPIKFVGRVSMSNIDKGLFSCDLETYTGSVDKGRPMSWDHETQMSRDPSRIDRAMEMASAIEAGADRQISWPP